MKNSDPSPESSPQSEAGLTRRNFLAGTGASVLTFSLLGPKAVSGAEANSKVNIGLIGCGGRGQWITELFRKHGGYNVAAVADYFPDRANGAGEKFGVPSARRFSGLAAYEQLLNTDIDAAVIQSPPYFHPQQCEAAVKAGKHVYLAKPAAVDVPGCLKISDLAAQATARKLCFLIDFQTRANKWYQEAAHLVHQGGLGRIISVEAAYQCDLMFENLDQQLRKEPKNPEVRLRAWAIDRALSGDVITEQNIHALDVASWMIDAEPVRAVGTGGRTREFLGDCWDHFAVIFYYPNDVIVSFNSRQAGFGYDDIMCRVYGTEGTVDTHYGGKVTVRTKESRASNETGNLYLEGAVNNIATFHEDVTGGRFGNPTVAPSIRSNLTTILGRMAAYKGGMVTWREMMRRKDKLSADLKGLRA